ncbi:MAG: 23S rRNA (uracil(1939)-C(5))-methyltransferase RlmD, partial [Chlamydiae bacterium]|nr:23S rRNA (uracil(1939)-C(5))-methyltransferase RlmD [Chlamydiota bacterium]
METKPQINQKIELTLKGLGIHGEGVGSWQGYTLFVDGALPGEVIEARIVEAKRSFGRAQALSYRTRSPHRVTPSCPLFGKCGG